MQSNESPIGNIDDIIDYIQERVVDDGVLLKTILLTIYSSQTDNPLNLYIKGETSTGKSFTVKNVLSLFKNKKCIIHKDIWVLGNLSPTAIYYDKSEFYDLNRDKKVIEKKTHQVTENDKLKNMSERQKHSSIYFYEDDTYFDNPLNDKIENGEIELTKVIELSGKTLVFFEAPKYETFQMLRPLLSHDDNELEYKITQDQKVMTVILRGHPASIFCQAQSNTKDESMAEIASRCVTVSPEEKEAKYKKANSLIARRFAFGEKKKDIIKESNVITFINNAIIFLKRSNVGPNQTINPNPLTASIPISKKLCDNLPSTQGSDMRHFEQYCQLINLHTLFNAVDRPVMKFVSRFAGMDSVSKRCFSNQQDYEFLLNILELFGSSIRGGLPKSAIDVFSRYILPAGEDGIRPKDIATAMIKDGVNRSPKALLKNEIAHLRSEQWIEGIVDQDDRRMRLFRSLTTDKEIIKDMLYENKNKLIEFSSEDVSEWYDDFNENNLYLKNDDLKIELQHGLFSESLTEKDFLKGLESRPEYPKEFNNISTIEKRNIIETDGSKEVTIDAFQEQETKTENKEVNE